jgi:hypothetical protein
MSVDHWKRLCHNYATRPSFLWSLIPTSSEQIIWRRAETDGHRCIQYSYEECVDILTELDSDGIPQVKRVHALLQSWTAAGAVDNCVGRASVFGPS